MKLTGTERAMLDRFFDWLRDGLVEIGSLPEGPNWRKNFRRWRRAYNALCASEIEWPGLEEHLAAQDALMAVRSRTLAERDLQRKQTKRHKEIRTEMLWAASVVGAALGKSPLYDNLYSLLRTAQFQPQSANAIKQSVSAFRRAPLEEPTSILGRLSQGDRRHWRSVALSNRERYGWILRELRKARPPFVRRRSKDRGYFEGVLLRLFDYFKRNEFYVAQEARVEEGGRRKLPILREAEWGVTMVTDAEAELLRAAIRASVRLPSRGGRFRQGGRPGYSARGDIG